MIGFTKDKKTIIIAGCTLFLVIIIIVLAVLLKNKNNTKESNSKANDEKGKTVEKFTTSAMSDESIFNSDNLLALFNTTERPNIEMISLSNKEKIINEFNDTYKKLDKKIKSLESELSTVNSGMLPIGSVMLWFDPGSIPNNWVVCDGSSYEVTYNNKTKKYTTPNLVGKFIKGSGSKDSLVSESGDGKIKVEHLPVHSHIVENQTGLSTTNSGGHFHNTKHLSKTPDPDSTYTYSTAYVTSDIKDYPIEKDGDTYKGLHSHDIPDHTHTISDSVGVVDDIRTDNKEQSSFEPKYNEAIFIYYLGPNFKSDGKQ